MTAESLTADSFSLLSSGTRWQPFPFVVFVWSVLLQTDIKRSLLNTFVTTTAVLPHCPTKRSSCRRLLFQFALYPRLQCSRHSGAVDAGASVSHFSFSITFVQ